MSRRGGQRQQDITKDKLGQHSGTAERTKMSDSQKGSITISINIITLNNSSDICVQLPVMGQNNAKFDCIISQRW